ncbi:MAG: hypothetical protein ABFD97_20505 [Syntrophobacter sp.]
MKSRWVIVIAVMVTLIAGAGFRGTAFGAGANSGLPELAGVYKSAGARIILANHPKWPTVEYVGEILQGNDQQIQPIRVRCDSVKGCHGAVYSGTLANQSAVELNLEGERLTVRYYNGPTLVLDREKQD